MTTPAGVFANAVSSSDWNSAAAPKSSRPLGVTIVTLPSDSNWVCMDLSCPRRVPGEHGQSDVVRLSGGTCKIRHTSTNSLYQGGRRPIAMRLDLRDQSPRAVGLVSRIESLGHAIGVQHQPVSAP